MSTAAGASVDAGASGWSVRSARIEDVPAAARAVSELLIELGATPPPVERMEEMARLLVEAPDSGLLLVAASDGELVGVLAASWQSAMHAGGRYGQIQDLWVRPSHRGSGTGRALVDELVERASERGIQRLEVGLPKESFAGFADTQAFYRACGFAPLGPRMRRTS